MLVWMLKLSGVFPQVMSLSPGSRGLPDSLNVLVRTFPTGMEWRTKGSSSICFRYCCCVVSYLTDTCMCEIALWLFKWFMFCYVAGVDILWEQDIFVEPWLCSDKCILHKFFGMILTVQVLYLSCFTCSSAFLSFLSYWFGLIIPLLLLALAVWLLIQAVQLPLLLAQAFYLSSLICSGCLYF